MINFAITLICVLVYLVPACVSYITCIAQVTLKFMNNILLVYLLDLAADKDWLNDCMSLLS